MLTSNLFRSIYCMALCTMLAVSLLAQTVPDSRGREFYFTFPPNFHENNNRDSLFIFIAAAQPTTGNIAYRNSSGTRINRVFTISDVSKVYSFAVSYRNIELGSAFNNTGSNQNGKVAPQSFHVTADQDIAVYALSYSNRTSDAMMVLPTDVLGTEYMVLAYNSDGLDKEPTPSQLAVVAPEDNTDVVITPSTRVLNGSMAPISIRLNSGDSYLLQADVSQAAPYNDLTGSTISTTKPVAVFAGHQRTVVPVRSSALISRDYLLEQLPPVQAWGRRHILTPFPLPAGIPATENDLYRVLAAHDNTAVAVNGTQLVVLRAGEIYEAPLRTAAVVEANMEVLVAQYKRSSSQQSTDLRISDPFMLVVPPVRQYLSSYLCINAQNYDGGKVYQQQYLTIICPASFVHTVTLDGQAVDPNRFLPVPTSCYSYAIIPVQDGVHKVEAATEIGIYIYGYGQADSYGYVGGMAFRKHLGEGGNIAFTMAPSFVHASPGDTIALDIHASSLEWQDMAAVSFSMELAYKFSWMTYAGTFTRGNVLDDTWSIEVQETEGDAPGTKKTTIVASGSTPVAQDGTIATIRMLLFMNTDTVYTPSLSASVNGDINCVKTTAASLHIGLSQCVINLSPIHYSGSGYGLGQVANASASTGVLRLRYSVGIEAETRIELFNSLGERISTLVDTVKPPGAYEQEADVSQYGAGAYFIRMVSGPYSHTLPIVLGSR